MQQYRFKISYKKIDIFQYKIVDQSRKQLKQFDKTQLLGIGPCSIICMAVVKLLSELDRQSIKEILQILCDTTTIRSTCQQIIKCLKTQRRGYIKTHRYEFGKDDTKTKYFLSSPANPVQILNFLQNQINQNMNKVFFYPKICFSGQNIAQYQNNINQMFNNQKVWVIKSNNSNNTTIGIFLNKDQHFVSFMMNKQGFHLFNSLDEPSIEDYAIKLIISQLLIQTQLENQI